ncbi:MAG: SH3 domain-containing protein [Blautia sp.]|nr:SH3 domain-containing protein [Blautia sp.]
MDDFREWLSDNLRYFELGGIILLVFLVLIFGIRSCLGRKGSTEVPPAQTDGNTVSMDGDTGSKKLEDATADIVQLIESYFKALNAKDLTAVKQVVQNLLPTDEPMITNPSYENYVLDKVYTMDGVDENSKVAVVTFTSQSIGNSTPIPQAHWMYLTKDEGGSWKIDGTSSENATVSSYIDSLRDNAEVKTVIDKVEKAYQDTLSAHPELAQEEDGASAKSNSDAAKDGEKLVTTTDVNVRASASSDSEKLGLLDEGTAFTGEGREGDWVKFTYEGQTAYVHGDYVQAAE